MRKSISGTILAMSLTLGAQIASAQTANVPPDNTRSNKTDLNSGSATADAQKDDQSDMLLTQNIRKQVVADKSLSTYAHNVKIVAVNGTVTLNGVVRSKTERKSIQAKAVAVAGRGHVVNDLKIAPVT